MKIIGITTESENIAKMLGIENNHEYGLYQETEMGSFYAKFLSDGTFEEKVILFISDTHASGLENYLSSIITHTEKKIEKLISSNPVIDINKFTKNIDAISRHSNELAEQMGKDIQQTLKRAGFNPTLRKDLLCSIG